MLTKKLSTSEVFTYISNRGQSSIPSLQRGRNWINFNYIRVQPSAIFDQEFDVDFESWAIHLEVLPRLQGHIHRANDEHSILLTISPSLKLSILEERACRQVSVPIKAKGNEALARARLSVTYGKTTSIKIFPYNASSRLKAHESLIEALAN